MRVEYLARAQTTGGCDNDTLHSSCISYAQIGPLFDMDHAVYSYTLALAHHGQFYSYQYIPDILKYLVVLILIILIVCFLSVSSLNTTAVPLVYSIELFFFFNPPADG